MLQLPQYTPARVLAPDGVAVAVQDWGAPATSGRARDVLFLHGFSQSHQSWLHQVAGPLAQQFRLVTYDLRGHGDSDKPVEPHFYQEPQRWAAEVKAVIDQLGLYRPILVAWSYAGRIALDYLSCFGEGALGGLVMVNATSKTDPTVLGPAASLLREMCDPDPVVNTAGNRALLAACVAQPLSAEALAYLLEFNQKVPPQIRANLRRPPGDYATVLAALTLPVLIVHGLRDPINLPAMAAYTHSQAPHARLIAYEQAAHMPFWEEPERFNADLAAFIRGLPPN